MQAQPRAARSASTFPVNKVVAAGLWLVGALATYALIAALLIDAPWYIAASTALAVQAGFTAIEYRFFNGGKRNEVGAVALILDVMANVGGVYPVMRRIGETATGKAVADVAGVQPTINGVTAFVFAVVLSYLLARAPEYVWDAD